MNVPRHPLSAPDKGGVIRISAREAKAMMESGRAGPILDVRSPEEYAAGHLPGAVCLPVDTVSEQTAAAHIPHRDDALLVYCRSGARSRRAAAALAALGYPRVYDLGGILDWPYETEP